MNVCFDRKCYYLLLRYYIVEVIVFLGVKKCLFLPIKFINSQLNHSKQNKTAIITRKTNLRRPRKDNQFKACKKTQKLQYKQLMGILESISDNVLALDNNWNVTYTSKRQANIFGYKASEMVGKNFWQLLPNLIGTEIEKNFQEAMQKREKKCYEITGIFKSGYYEQSIFPSANGITIYTKDITERKKIEVELIQKTVAIEQAHNAIFITDPDFQLLMWNKGAEELYGFKPQEVLGKTTDFLHTRYVGQTEKEVIKQIVEHKGWNGEAVQKRKDGTNIYTLITVTQIQDDTNVLGYTAVMRDITELKQTEEELRKSRQRLNDIIESICDDVFSIDRNWNFIYVNRYAAERWGYKPNQLAGKNIWKSLPKLAGTILEKNFREAMQKRQVKQFEWKTLYATGIRDITVFPSAEGITVYAKDITERKKAEQDLRQSEERFARLFHSSPAALFISRLDDGLLIDVNDSFLKILEYNYTEVIGHTVFELNIYFDPNKRRDIIHYLKMHRTMRNYEVIIRTKTCKCITVIASLETIILNGQYVLLGTFIDITERKKAEQALKISEEQLRVSLDAGQMGVWRQDMIKGEIYLDERARTHYGLTKNKINLLEAEKFVHPEDIKILKKEIDKASRPNSNERFNTEYRVIHPDGTVHWLSVGVRIVFGKNGHKRRPIVGFGTTQDITDRKKAEELLKISEERFRFVAEAANVMVYESIFGSDEVVIVRGMEELLGYKIEKQPINYHWWMELAHPDDIQRVNKQLKATMENKKSKGYAFEYRVRHKNGNYIIVKDTAKIIRDENCNPVRIIGGIRDITDRTTAEETLRQSEERLKSAQKIAHVGNWEFYLKENKAIWSEELFNIFKIKPKQYGPSLEEYSKLIHPDDIDMMNKIMGELLSKGRLGDGVSLDYRILTNDGSIRVLHSQRMIGALDKEGKPSKIIGIEQDITERKKIEQQLEQYSKDLEILVEERTKQLKDAERLATIGQVAGMVGHDIRNPLQAIFSELYFAKQSVLESPQNEDKHNALESLSIIQEQAEYISKIVTDLQDYAKTLKPEIKEVDLNELINSTFLAINVPKRITLSTKIEKSLKLNTDPTFIRRAITNLANNAIQAMPKEGKLTITATKIDKQVRILVEDTGEGIPKEVRDKLFTPLFTTKSKGQGFGLAVTRRLIEALGGTISFESQVGKGTIFQIELPL